MGRKLTAGEKRKCAEVVLDFILQKVEELDDAIYEFIPEEIGEDEEKMNLVIDEFNVFNEQKIIREAFEAKYGKIKESEVRDGK